MYDELIKDLRICAEGEHCDKCGKWEVKQNGGRNACEYAICTEAADAIEGLGREAEEYKAAYRKEHNKRIAENRHLYDELTKAVKEKLLMTPMRSAIIGRIGSKEIKCPGACGQVCDRCKRETICKEAYDEN